jgi:hypothetical protein
MSFFLKKLPLCGKTIYRFIRFTRVKPKGECKMDTVFNGKKLFEEMIGKEPLDKERVIEKELEYLKLQIHIPSSAHRFYVNYYINAEEGVVEVVLTAQSLGDEIRCTLSGEEVTFAQIIKAIKNVRDQGVKRGLDVSLLSAFINEIGLSILRQMQVEKEIAEVFVEDLMFPKKDQ